MICKESRGWGWLVCVYCTVLSWGESIASFLSSSPPLSLHPLANLASL